MDIGKAIQKDSDFIFISSDKIKSEDIEGMNKYITFLNSQLDECYGKLQDSRIMRKSDRIIYEIKKTNQFIKQYSKNK